MSVQHSSRTGVTTTCNALGLLRDLVKLFPIHSLVKGSDISRSRPLLYYVIYDTWSWKNCCESCLATHLSSEGTAFTSVCIHSIDMCVILSLLDPCMYVGLGGKAAWIERKAINTTRSALFRFFCNYFLGGHILGKWPFFCSLLLLASVQVAVSSSAATAAKPRETNGSHF